jgi:hypothetical protein
MPLVFHRRSSNLRRMNLERSSAFRPTNPDSQEDGDVLSKAA